MCVCVCVCVHQGKNNTRVMEVGTLIMKEKGDKKYLPPENLQNILWTFTLELIKMKYSLKTLNR